ncbi:uncharacterized protein LOC116969908 isoform X2 [Amblyraja radiata]|uniref:uncharacterized protein LOC116969908 isoform X2 n=1 Tax=Amblyraja radiata TaxID=386614 RepID=UPI0014020E29|nr:uncharacterized protein LOC116969908 isoform X2 [Amblyraja radiata]
MWIHIFLLLTFIIQACTQNSTQVRKYIFATVFDSILLTGNIKEVKNNQIIQWSFIDRLQKSLMLFHSVGVDSPSLSPYYQHRCKYYASNGTLELQRLEIADSGIYQLTVDHFYENAPETLSTPLIIQEPVYIANNVQLSCIAKKGNPSTILWLKGNIPITNGSRYILRDNNSTLSISRVDMDHCGFYTCVAVDSTSEQNITHFLLIDGIQFLHKRILVTSVVAFVSTSMSLAATVFIIFYSLKKYKANKYQDRSTIAFMVIEMKSYVCLLISSILCILDSDIFVVYRIISGIVVFQLLGMTGYIAFLYLHPFREELASFLVKKRERYIILGSGIFNVIISPLPIYEASLNVRMCTYPYGDIAVAIVSTLMLFISIVGLCFIFAVKRMQTWNLSKRSSRLWSK